MNWKRVALVVVGVILVLKFSDQIRGVLSGVPLINKVL